MRHEFLQSLPELFNLVANSNHEMAAIVITTMKTAACQKCSDVLDLISSACPKWFGKFIVDLCCILNSSNYIRGFGSSIVVLVTPD